VTTAIIVIGILIVIGLSAYASKLLLQVKRQTEKKRQAQAERDALADEKRQQVLTDIRYIATAMLEDRCELSEGVVRIGKLFDILSMTEQVTPLFPQLFTHYDVIKSHPIMEARKALPKQQRMKLDFARMRSEADLGDAIMAEAKQIAEFKAMKNH
jgi:hypothetical protein